MAKTGEFKDLNFKLAVIDVLMYQKKVLKPEFDIREFAKTYKKRKINIEKQDNKVIREAQKYFKDLFIPSDLLSMVDSIHQGYHKVYHQVIPFWDGEGDEFNITSTDDLALVPNLKSIVLLYDNEQKMVKEFEAKGIDARYL